MDGLDRQLAAVAARQHCLVTLKDVRAAGGNAKHAERRVATGRWEFVFEGVYRLAGVPWTWEARVMALVLARPGAVASYLCAARLHEIGFGTAFPEVSIPRGRFHQADGLRVHTSTDLDRCQVVLRNGIPTTDPARTLLDLGRFIREPALAIAVKRARRQELVDWRDLIETLATHARKGRHGVTRLRNIIADGVALDDLTDTDSELAALSLLRERGFGEPAQQHRVYDSDGELLAAMDLAYVDKWVNFEIDGPVHLQPEVSIKDDDRDHMLRSMGWTVRRIWYEIPVRQPEKFVQIVRETFRSVIR